MPNSENMHILNPDYYSAAVYETDENTKPIFLKVLIQLAFLVIIFSALFFSYKLILKNDFFSLDFFLETEVNVKKMPSERILSVENISKKEIIIREEEEVIVSEPVTVKKDLAKVQVLEKKKIESKSVPKSENNIILTDEYINLVKSSLGNN